MIFKIAIVEDEVSCQENIKAILSRYSKEHQMEFSFCVFDNGVKFLDEFKPFEFDIVFMDIDMPGLNGLETSREMRLKDDEVALVFVTDLAQYAIKGYEVDAYDFIVKPVNYEHLVMKFDRLIPVVSQRKMQKPILFSKNAGGGRIVAVEPNNIKYIEIISHDTIIHAMSEDIHIIQPLNEVAKLLPTDMFFRCNYCYIVNMKFVSKIDGYNCQLGTGEIISISRPRKKNFVNALMDYLGGRA